MNKTIDIKTDAFEGANHLRIYLHYDKGNGWNRKRGYYMSVRPVEISEQVINGYRIQSVGFVGVDDRARTYLLETTERYNKKVFDGFAGRIEQNRQEIHDAIAAGNYKEVWRYVYGETTSVFNR